MSYDQTERPGGLSRCDAQLAILVDIDFGGESVAMRREEFAALVSAARFTGIEWITATRGRIDVQTFFGRYYAEYAAERVMQTQAQVLCFNHELSPSQVRNLERMTCCVVLDRTELILTIFAQRAKSYEGKLQVELAQLQHLRTRLIRGWTHLERQKGGIGLRGPGETQLETDKRLIGQRIEHIKKRLNKVKQSRQQNRQSRKRSKVPVIALVGYTSAGKSTLINALANARQFASEQLFATLDPGVKRMLLPGVGYALLVDTVGFVSDLPHELIEAFSATLEEVRQADLCLHVIDAAHPHQIEQMRCVHEVMAQIGVESLSCCYAFNKSDIGQANLSSLSLLAQPGVAISATTGAGLSTLRQLIATQISGSLIDVTVDIGPAQGRCRSYLHEIAAVLDEEAMETGGWRCQLRIGQSVYNEVQRLLIADQ